MKVKEYMELLAKMPQDAEVFVEGNDEIAVRAVGCLKSNWPINLKIDGKVQTFANNVILG